MKIKIITSTLLIIMLSIACAQEDGAEFKTPSPAANQVEKIVAKQNKTLMLKAPDGLSMQVKAPIILTHCRIWMQR